MDWHCGATGPTTTATQALKGKKLSVRVTASALGYPTTSAVSAATAAVQPGVLSNTASPTVTGDPRVDSTLTAQPGSWDPAPTGIGYQWMADGTPVPGATSPTLALNPSFVGKAITVKVTATKAGYAAVGIVSAATRPVAPGTLSLTSTPTVSGTVAPGHNLLLAPVKAGRGATTHVQWVRAGTPVPGATSRVYRLTSTDLGKRLRARIRVTRPGYTTLVVRTPWSRLVRTRPTVRMSTAPGAQRLALRVTMRAAGLSGINNRVQVRTGGRLVRVVPIRGGAASTTLTGLRPGTRTYKFRIPATSSTEPVVITRRLTIR